ncbi:MAG: LicD family protein [Methanobrevibacter sp.]|nr:LicD family protein [Methanobrevibacter sp.]
MFFDKSKNEVNKDELICRTDFEKLQTLAKVHQDYLNNIFVYYRLKPTPFLESFHDLSYEILRLFDNVCRKHDLAYWLDYGTLLGSLRHEDFIPWDESIDVGMVQSDYMKLADVFESEKDSDNIDCRINDESFVITYVLPEIKDKVAEINVNCYSDGELEEKSEIIFPLKQVKFGKYYFSSPNDINEYLDDIYGKKYSKIPKKLQKYDHLMHLRGIENCEELLAKAAQEIKRINDAHDI